MSASNPKQAHGDHKRKIHLVPAALTIGAAQAAAEGARKYGPYNWRLTKVQATTYIVSAMRHLLAFLDGEDLDLESDVTGDGSVHKHHLDGAAMSLAILMDAIEGGFVIDDRPPKGPAPRLLRDPKFAGEETEGPFDLETIEHELIAAGVHIETRDRIMRRLLGMP